MKNYPILRLVIFLAAGIFFADKYQIQLTFWGWGILLLLLVFLGWLVRNHSFGMRFVFGLGVSVFMFILGIVVTERKWKEVEAKWEIRKRTYTAVVLDSPIEKRKTIQCRSKVGNKQILLYLLKDSLSTSIKVGERLMFYAQIKPPANLNDSVEFDYAQYLFHEGICGVAYVSSPYWRKTNDDHLGVSIKEKALLVREKILGKFKTLGISRENLPVFSALTLGYKGDLSQDIKQSYSVAGISHVLALSGMHIGIIWLLLDCLLKPITLIRRLHWLHWFVITAFLWFFAFIVGLEPSVIRAVFMCMLIGLGKLLGIRVLSMNILAVAAFFMLLYNPFYLFDVGFQLSFVAVASIFLFYSMVLDWIVVRNRLGRWLWGIMVLSFVAQLGTAPLVMYYFSNFSIYFLFTNIISSVLVPLIIYGAILLGLLFPFEVLSHYIVKVINVGVYSLNEVAMWVSTLPGATISFSKLIPLEIMLFYALLFIMLAYGKKQERKWILRGLFVCMCMLMLHLWIVLEI